MVSSATFAVSKAVNGHAVDKVRFVPRPAHPGVGLRCAVHERRLLMRPRGKLAQAVTGDVKPAVAVNVAKRQHRSLVPEQRMLHIPR